MSGKDMILRPRAELRRLAVPASRRVRRHPRPLLFGLATVPWSIYEEFRPRRDPRCACAQSRTARAAEAATSPDSEIDSRTSSAVHGTAGARVEGAGAERSLTASAREVWPTSRGTTARTSVPLWAQRKVLVTSSPPGRTSVRSMRTRLWVTSVAWPNESIMPRLTRRTIWSRCRRLRAVSARTTS